MFATRDSGIEWVGSIPKDWDMRRLQYCLNEIKVKNNPVQTTQVLSLMKDIGVLPYEEKGDIGNKAKEDVSEYHLAYPDTIVLNCMNILIGSVGISKYFGCVSPVYYVFRESEDCDLRFINYIFNTREFQKELRRYAKGILEIRLRVSADDIFKRKIPIPPKQTQSKIADFLDTKCDEIDSLSEDIQKEIEILETYRQSIISEAVTKGEETRFKYIATVRSNLVNPALYQDYHQIAPDSIEKNTGKIIIERTVEDAAVDSWNHLFYKGQIIYSKIRPVLNKVIIAPYDGLCSADMYPIETMQDTRFLMYVMLSQYFVEQVDLITRDRIKMPKINQDELGNIKVFMPSLQEQKEIVKYLDDKCGEIDAIISHKQQQQTILLDYKKSLIYEYVTGKKVMSAV